MMNNAQNFLHQLLLQELQSDDGGELISIVADPEGEEPKKTKQPATLPILPIRNTVLFPGVVLPITVSRKKSIRLVKKAYRGDKTVGVVAQKNMLSDDPASEDLYQVGTVAKILKVLVLPDGNTTIIIQGQSRFRIEKVLLEQPFLTAQVSHCKDSFPNKNSREVKALVQSLKDAAAKMLKLNPEIPQEAQIALDNIDSPGFLTHFLRQQIKVLQDELGFDGPDQEIEKMRAAAAKKKWPEPVAKHFNKELDKLGRINPQAAEYPIALNYCEFLIELPWGENTKDNFNLKRAKKILDTDHYGLDKV